MRHSHLINEVDHEGTDSFICALLVHTIGGHMPVVEIHIKDNEVQKIEGHGTYVLVHDHDTKETTTMIFKKQEEVYENTKNIRHNVNETVPSEKN